MQLDRLKPGPLNLDEREVARSVDQAAQQQAASVARLGHPGLVDACWHGFTQFAGAKSLPPVRPSRAYVGGIVSNLN